MSPVISKRAAQALLKAFETGGGLPVLIHGRVLAELRQSLRAKKFVKAAKVRRKAKALTKKAQRASVRDEVMLRAGGACELCNVCESSTIRLELHHALGRVRVKESASNCLAVCNFCHAQISNNKPSAAYWLDLQSSKFHAFGHSKTVRALDSRLDFVRAREELSKQSAGAAP